MARYLRLIDFREGGCTCGLLLENVFHLFDLGSVLKVFLLESCSVDVCRGRVDKLGPYVVFDWSRIYGLCR